MKRVVSLGLFVLAISTPAAWAQLSAAISGGMPPRAGGLELNLDAAAAGLQVQPAARQEPPPPPPRPRRRGSMVGYIEDAVIETKLRVRLDLAFENRVPDRAEFFYGKCGCYGDLDPRDPAYDPAAPGPRPGAASDLDFQQLHLSGEYAFSNRLSAFGQLPFRWLQPHAFLPGTGAGFPSQAGVSDIRAGMKVGLVASDDRSVTGQVRLFFPTGDAGEGLGTDHASVEPALLYRQRVNDIVAVESQAGIWVPFDGAAPVPSEAGGSFSGDVFFYGVGPSFALYRSDRVRFAPVVELVGWRVLNGNQTASLADAGGTNIVNLKLGARTVFERGSVYAGYGLALTDESWYDDVLRLEYRVEF